jgi:cytochrome P450
VTCGRAEISTCDPELAWEIARRPRDFQQPSTTALIMGQFGRNVLTDNGEKWAKQRKVVAGVINERISKTVFNESIKQTEGLLGEVYERADGGVSDSNRLFDMMKKITIHVLSGAGMGASVAWNGNDDEKPREGYKMTYIEACKTVINGVAGPIILPIWLMKNWPWFMPGHEFLQALAPAMIEFPLHTKHLLEQERQRTLSHGGQTQSNIMSQLLQASEQEEKSKALTEEEMLGNLFIFTAAGFDTTANTLSYALVLLCRYPEWQDWILEEVDALLPPSASSEPVDYAAIFPKVTRIMAVMLETLRIFVPVIHLARDTQTPQSIQTSTRTYNIPADCFVYVDSIALHLDKTLWRDLNQQPGPSPNPTNAAAAAKIPDEQTFRPTRWINPPGSPHPLFQPPRGAYVPWSAGPRVCPGQKMAQVEFTAIFLTLFRRHRIEVVPLKVGDVIGGGDGGREETREEVDARLDALMRESISVLTLQMVGVYDVGVDGVGEGEGGKGLPVRFRRRR